MPQCSRHLQAEKNLAWEAAQQQAQAQAQLNAMGAQAGSGPCKLLVTNLNVQLAVSLLLPFLLPDRSFFAFSIKESSDRVQSMHSPQH